MTSQFRNFRFYGVALVLLGSGLFSQPGFAAHSLPAKNFIGNHYRVNRQDHAELYSRNVNLDQRLLGSFPEDFLSIKNSDKSRAKKLLPFDADVQIVKRQAHSDVLQVIGTNKEEVWAFDFAFQVAKVKRIGKIFLPDGKTLSRIERAVSGSKIILAFQIVAENLPAENPWSEFVSTIQTHTAFVQAQDSLYKVSFNAGDNFVVQRLGELKN